MGDHRYKFIIELPKELPSSYEGVHGFVRYVIKAFISRPHHGFDTESEKIFTVMDSFDLNAVRYEAMVLDQNSVLLKEFNFSMKGASLSLQE